MNGMVLLRHAENAAFCPPDCRQVLGLRIDEVLGESTRVEVGRTYIVRGLYTLSAPGIARLCLSALGRSHGTAADLALGSRTFELTATPEEVESGREQELDVVMFDPSGAELGVRLRILLRGSR